MSFQRYPAYRDSGVETVSDIPFHWKTSRLKFLFDLVKRLPEENDEIVTAFRDGFVSLRKNRRVDGFTNSINDAGYQRVLRGDLVIHSMDAFSGAVGVSDSDGKSTPVYSVCQPKSMTHAQYYGYLLRALALSGFITSLAKGIRERSTEFRWAEAGNVELPVPPFEEQKIIATFLDRETARIDALVTEQEKLIDLLKEKRQAVISRAVTKGLDPQVPMKDSGIAWLGEVPAHWEKAMLGRVCDKIADGPHFSPDYVDDGVMFISARNIKVDKWSFDDVKFISEEDYVEFCKRIIPEKGDVLYTKGGTTGIARVVDFDEKFQIWVHVAVIKVNHELIYASYLAHALNSVGSYEQSQLLTRGATNQDLGLTRMIRIWIAIPPLREQERIVKYLDKCLGEIDSMVSEAQKAITLLKERRAALISAAVTGRIDVRDRVAAGVTEAA